MTRFGIRIHGLVLLAFCSLASCLLACARAPSRPAVLDWQSPEKPSDVVPQPLGTFEVAVGSSWSEAQELTIDGTIRGLRGLPVAADLHAERSSLAHVEVLAIDAADGLPASVRIVVEKAAGQMTLGPKQQLTREAIEGHSYVAERDGGWTYHRPDGGDVSDEEASALSVFGLGWRIVPTELMSRGDVQVGARLTLDEAWLAYLGLARRGIHDLVLTFVGPEQGARRFHIDGVIETSKKDISAKGPLTGTLDLRPQDSWPLHLALDGDFVLDELDADHPGSGNARVKVSWTTVPQAR
ncbi:MAG: hypothetical protein KC731_12900 [Myxococcales bacterium]|nr:hypothetical protein [Myxococcales bacterium]